MQSYEDPAFTAFASATRPNSPEVQLLTKFPTALTFANVQQTASQAFGPQNLANNTGCGTPSTDNIPCATPVIDQGVFNSSSYNNSKQYDVRIDKYFKKDRVYGLFYRDTISTNGPSVRPGFDTTNNYYTFSLQGNETHTFSPHVLNEALSNFHLGAGGSFAQQVANGVVTPQSHTLASDLNYVFSARGGFAYAPGGDNKNLLHGGIGLFHDYFTLGNSENGLSANPPGFVRPTFYNNGSTAAPVFGFGTQETYPLGYAYPAFQGQPLNAKGGIVGSQISIGGVDSNLKSPYTTNFNLALDRQVTPNVVVSLGYVGSVSNDLVAAGGNTGNTAYGNDVNVFAGDLIQHISCQLTGTAPNQTSTCTGVQTRLNTSFGSVNYSYNAAHGNYNGLIASGRGRLGQKAFFTASYTRSWFGQLAKLPLRIPHQPVLCEQSV